MGVATRAAKQLMALRKMTKPNLNDLQNYSTILDASKKAGTRQRLYNETGMHSAWDVIKKRRGK
mgnify:FL=1|jgi:hypothetical protein|tara:strand:+ start:1881 stop:2072 length:192 start_codon:yes stop_codon:yes gene_type:complete